MLQLSSVNLFIGKKVVLLYMNDESNKKSRKNSLR